MSDTTSHAVSISGARKWINDHAVAVIVGITAMIAVAVTLELLGFGSICDYGPPKWAWYAVEGTQEFMVDEANLIPPIERDGKRLVRAHFYGCDDCDAANRFLGYFEKYSDEAKAGIERLKQSVPAGGALDEDAERLIYELTLKGRLYSTDGKIWLPAESEEAQMILEKLSDKCASRKLAACYPESAQGWNRRAAPRCRAGFILPSSYICA